MSNAQLAYQKTEDRTAQVANEVAPIRTLYELLELNITLFVTAIMELEGALNRVGNADEDGSKFRSLAFRILPTLKKECELANLVSCKEALDRIEKRFFNSSPQVLIVLFSDLRGHIQDELYKRKFFLIDPMEEHLYSGNFISKNVLDKFPSAYFELSEAGKCLVFRLPTAAVCHSMRALEVGLSSLSKALGAEPPNENWSTIIGECRKAIKNLPNKEPRPADWKDDLQWYSECATEFETFKLAWRNHAMHRTVTYARGHAVDILHSVSRFLTRISERLSEIERDEL